MAHRKRGGRTILELKAAVRRGVALLERTFPGRWRRMFVLRNFRFNDPCRCIIGTIGSFQGPPTEDSNWERGKVALGLSMAADATEDCGFDWVNADEAPILARFWRQVLTQKPLR